jgi:cytochrome c-type biogenesis protein CcmH/NrfG
MAIEARKAMSLYQNDIVLLRRSVKIAPRNVAAWGLLGDAEAKIGDENNAQSCYQKAVALRPDHWDTNFHLAMHYLKHGRKEDAHESLRKSLASPFARPSEKALSWFEMGRIEAAEGRVGDAGHSFLEAEKLEPSSKKVQAELARLTEGHISRQPN